MPFDGTLPDLDADVRSRVRDVIAYLDEHGWCQDKYRDSDGRVCLVGAFERSGSMRDDVAYLALRRVARLAGCHAHMDLIEYNDGLDAMAGKYGLRDLLVRAAEDYWLD